MFRKYLCYTDFVNNVYIIFLSLQEDVNIVFLNLAILTMFVYVGYLFNDGKISCNNICLFWLTFW